MHRLQCGSRVESIQICVVVPIAIFCRSLRIHMKQALLRLHHHKVGNRVVCYAFVCVCVCNSCSWRMLKQYEYCITWCHQDLLLWYHVDEILALSPWRGVPRKVIGGRSLCATMSCTFPIVLLVYAMPKYFIEWLFRCHLWAVFLNKICDSSEPLFLIKNTAATSTVEWNYSAGFDWDGCLSGHEHWFIRSHAISWWINRDERESPCQVEATSRG